ncbi:MAG: hypothetical protein E6J90_15520 [Deltaproteobacteria bacterium]|nr:MAG: hypothetical protein E6J91_46070 [Deltaproteobacteria bacterium]TMQ20777.1 MAG: hypothetical protein E6J90_15520 [Deltaproteobacteria bacterium]
MSFESEKRQLAEELDRALHAMRAWSPERRLQYKVALGVKDRNAEFTQAFGGEAAPEPDSVAALLIPSSSSFGSDGSTAVLRLLHLLTHGDDICLDAPTARIITERPMIVDLLRVLKDAEAAGFVRRTAPDPRDLGEDDRDSLVGLALTAHGKRHLEEVLRTMRESPAPRVVAR